MARHGNGQNVMRRSTDGRFGLGTTAASLIESLQSRQGLGEAFMPDLSVLALFLRGTVPIKAKPFPDLIKSRSQVEHFWPLTGAGRPSFPQWLPTHLALGGTLGEGVHLAPAARQDGDELALLLV